MDCLHELLKWPTVVWTGMIALVGLTLTALAFWDDFMPMRVRLYENRMATKAAAKKRKR